MSIGPDASLVVEAPAARGGWLAMLRGGVIAPLLRGLRVCDPVWPGPAAFRVNASRPRSSRVDLDSRLLDHFAG